MSLTAMEPPCQFLPRDQSCHKHSVGRVVGIGGDMGMEGAIWLAALGALKTGVGLVSVLASPVMMTQIPYPEVVKVPQPLTSPEWAVCLDRLAPHALIIGPGITDYSPIPVAAILHWAIQANCPTVVDAGAMATVVSHHLGASHFILTPHHGEWTRYQMAQSAAVAACVVVKKGSPSTVCWGREEWRCPAGNPGMASAGMGDVLAGCLGGMVAQWRDRDLIDRVKAAVWAHSHAADGLATSIPVGYLASDVAMACPLAIAKMMTP